MNEWISVKDRIFPKTEKFLAYNLHSEQAVCWINGISLIRGEWFGTCEYGCGGQDFFENITHWMPLPNPPKE